MLAVMLLAASVAVSPLPLGELPPQTLAAGECALVLWERATGRRVAMLVQRPEAVRVVQDGVVKTLPKRSGDTALVAGFAPDARFAEGALQVKTALAIVANDAVGSAIVREGIMVVTGADGVEIVVPVAGIASCER